MSLAPVELPGSPSTTYEASSTSSPPSKPTVATALSLLQSLKPQIMEILGQEKLRVTLDRMDIMRSGRDDSENAHVMWVGPSLESPDARRLKRVCGAISYPVVMDDVLTSIPDMLQNAYLDAGLLVDARRPLKVNEDLFTYIVLTHYY
jgi:activating signal cointegrator complex subunit 1